MNFLTVLATLVKNYSFISGWFKELRYDSSQLDD